MSKRSRATLGAAATLALLAACDGLPPWLGGERPPPFELFGRGDMRPGVSIETLEKAAGRESRTYRWRCRPLWARARTCALTVQPGDLRAVVDSTGRVLRLTVVAPDSFFVWDDTPPNEPKYKYYVNRLRERWDGIERHRFGPTDAGVAEFRWVDPDGRWSAQMWYSPWSKYKTRSSALRQQYRDSLARVPDSIAVTDEPEYSKFVALRPSRAVVEAPTASEDDDLAPRLEPLPAWPRPSAPPTTSSDLRSLGIGLAASLRRVAELQATYRSKHGSYAVTLDELGWRSDTDDLVLQLTGVGSAGWAAVASHRALPSRSCVYYEGSVTHVPETFAERRPGSERSVICDSF